jgi:Domain of unknown function (DUF4261)
VTEGTPPAPAPSALVAELWFAQAPDLADPQLLEALRALSPDAQAQQGSITVPYRSAGANGQVDGGPGPLVTVVMPSSSLEESGKQRPDARQTWDWAGAEAAVTQAGAGVLVTELLVAGWSAQDRVNALTRVVDALAGWSPPVLVWWPHSQKVTDPETLADDDLNGIVNVRFFTVAGDDGAMVLDTLGLHVFGLPDLQCHFRDRDPGEIAGLLYATALYVYDSGDVIADGNTISGLDGEGRFVCRRETSLLEPTRLVLDVDLGDPYAAGARDR